MPSKISKTVPVKLSGSLVEAVDSIAAGEGMSAAEVLRACLRIEVGRREAAAHLATENVPTDILYRRAAFGDLLAQRELCDRAFQAAINESAEGNRGKALEAIGSSITLARAAVEHGEAFDQTRLAALLLIRGDMAKEDGDGDFAEMLDAQALARLDIAAEAGSEIAGKHLLGAAFDMSARSVEMAGEARAGIMAGR